MRQGIQNGTARCAAAGGEDLNRNDLFALFPDLPWHPRRAVTGQRDNVQRQLKETQIRVEENVARQRSAADRVRAAIRRRRSEVRPA